MTDDEIELRRTCFHESGHAVIAARLGLEVTEVSVIPSENEHGQSRLGHITHTFQRTPEGYRNSAICDLAGIYAEARYRGFPPLGPRYENNDQTDQRLADENLRHYCSGTALDFEKVRRECVWEMESLVAENWHHIVWLADHLFTFGKVSGFYLAPRR